MKDCEYITVGEAYEKTKPLFASPRAIIRAAQAGRIAGLMHPSPRRYVFCRADFERSLQELRSEFKPETKISKIVLV